MAMSVRSTNTNSMMRYSTNLKMQYGIAQTGPMTCWATQRSTRAYLAGVRLVFSCRAYVGIQAAYPGRFDSGIDPPVPSCT